MAINPAIDVASEAPTAEPGSRWVSTVLTFCRRRPLGAIGAGIVVIMLLVAAFAPFLAPYDPVTVDFGAMLSPPGAQHWLGTDAFGRDVLSRLIYGSRTALLVGFGSALLGATAGAVLGVGSAYFGGKIDLYLQRLMDVLLCFPLIILALAIVAILGNNLWNLILAITIPMIPRCALVIRSSALSIREMPYVDAARASGFTHRRIILRHMLPGAMAPVIVAATLAIADSVVVEATLSYLSFGISPPEASLGNMLTNALEFFFRAPTLIFIPGITLILVVLSASFIGDGLRDALDPRQRVTN